MVAPKGPGHLVRRTYQEGSGVPCLYAVEKDPSGDTEEVALAWASGIGGGRSGILELTSNPKLKLTSLVNKLYCAVVLLS